MKKTAVFIAMLFIMVCFYAQIGLSGSRYAQDGIEYYERGDYERAIKEFLSANHSANDRVPEYHYWLGRLHIAIADTANAMRWFDKYMASDDEAYRDQVDDYLRIIQRQKEIFARVNLRPMPGYINSGNSDYGAVTDPQKKYLYFTSMRPASKDKENIWRAEIFRAGYGRPQLVEELSTDKNESFGCFNSNGSSAWVFGNYEKDKLDGDIYRVGKNEGWSRPENAIQFNSPQVDTHPMLFRDRYFFFSSSRDGGFGGMDIYVSERIGGAWTEPVNLGPQINTAGNEQTPFLDHDGKTLFFASNGHPGFGGYDIFKAYHISTGWQDWSLPE
ncbi:MAG: OmpA family protein, partial [Candidatus Syntrophosphaera sp.]